MKQKKVNSIAALAIGLLVFCIVYFGWFSNLNLSLQDQIYQQEQTASPKLKVIAIDEKTLEALGQFETWTREPYARLLEVLNQKGAAPAVIGFDILFVNEKGPEDLLLAEACAEAGNVVMAKNLVFSTKIETIEGRYRANSMYIDMVEEPIDAFAPYVETGFANVVQDVRDGSVRYTLLAVENHTSFAMAVAQKAMEAWEIPMGYGKDLHIQTDVNSNSGMYIDYVGGSETYETLSMIDVLEGRIPAAAFADSIVLVGAHAAGMGDSYPVPAERGSHMYGVEINANIIQGILEGRSLTMVSLLLQGLCCGVIGVLLALLFAKVRIRISVLVAVILVVMQFLLCLWLDGDGVVVHMLGLPLAAGLALVWGIISKYVTETLQKRKIIRAFEKYAAPQVVEEIAQKHDYQLRLGGEKRHIAVLFVDIRGFTPLSESLEPEQVVEILNEYLSLVTEAVFTQGGTLDKFIGDAAMAVFNAPFDCEDYIYKAVKAAREIAAGSERIAETFRQRFGKEVSYGIGIHCGEAVVGNIGSEHRMDYTAIGDTVNTAARLESNAAPGQILVSPAVYEVVKERILAEPVGELQLKGKAATMLVYEVKEA